MPTETFRRLNSVPAIVRIVIKQAVRHRALRLITESVFRDQMRRIAREELEPKTLTLLVRDLPGGRTRLIIREKVTDTICDMLDFAADGSLESDSAETFAHAERDASLSSP